MEFLPKNIDNYVHQHTEAEPEILQKLHRETWRKVLIPRMLSGHLLGRALSLFSQLTSPKRIIEVGTYTGYSALCLSEGLAEGGELHTIDNNEELKGIQDKYFELSDYRKNIHQHIGNALDIIPQLDIIWDIAFIDADKNNYINYYELILPKLKTGGLILFDNVLWSGKVAQEIDDKDEDTKVLNRLNKLLTEDERVQNVLFPLRDGLMVIRKK